MAAVPTDGYQDKPLKYKTWVLKVSIHCEGCKRKVKRILHSVEGVYTIDVDARQQKVVVTGNVDANTLVRKLEKSGKHTELWPDFHKVSNNNQINEQQQQQQQEQGLQNQNQNPNVEKQKVTFNIDEPQKGNNESDRVAENCGPPPPQQPQQVKEVRFEGSVAGEPQKPPANNPGGGGGEGGGGGGAKKKKKKKKGNNGNNTTNNPNNTANNNNGGGGDVASVVMDQGTNGGPPSTESQQPPHPTHNPNHPDTMSPPRHHPPNGRVYEYPPPYYAPPPVYAVSYNTAYPSSSYTASYYSAPPPYSYANVHQGGDVEASAPLDWNPHAVPPSDSFEMFSDENPNACAVM